MQKTWGYRKLHFRDAVSKTQPEELYRKTQFLQQRRGGDRKRAGRGTIQMKGFEKKIAMCGVHVDPYSYKELLFDSYKIEY